jgi:hypothetical protein
MLLDHASQGSSESRKESDVFFMMIYFKMRILKRVKI